MLEGAGGEGNMDKVKSTTANRPSLPVKANAPDSKKPENGNGGRLPKSTRRRDSNNALRRNDNSQSQGRKPQPPRSRQNYDRRPRARGYFNDSPAKEIAQGNGAELGSVHRPGPKKGSLNHLLNFTFAPRERNLDGGTNWKGRNKWGGKTTLKYNKEQFLQANCQFIVKDTGDYSIHTVDPDVLVDWDLIEQVRIGSSEVPSCPICLYPPTAAKITTCGHMYCWSCILHYLSLGEKTWRKCPICYEYIKMKDLKSVVALETINYMPNHTITMKLMKREKGSTYAMPHEQWSRREGKLHQIDDHVDICFQKMLVASGKQVQDIIDDERRLLDKQFKEEGDSLNGSFIQAAIELLKERQASLNLKNGVNAELTEAMEGLHLVEEETKEASTTPWKSSPNAKKYSSAFSDEEIEAEQEMSTGCCPHESVSPIPAEAPKVVNDGVVKAYTVAADEPTELEEMPVEEVAENLAMPSGRTGGNMLKSDTKSCDKIIGSNYFYFYQAADGQHIYLHSLNARCLIKEYGSWENCPSIVEAPIVETEAISMTAELRRRLRYLSHLPLTCEFKVVELILKPPVLSKATLELMGDEIEKRHRARQRKAKDQRRKMKMMQDNENRKMGYYPDMRVSLQSARHFPSAGAEGHVEIEAPTLSAGSSVASTPFGSPHGQSGLNPYASEFVPGSPPSPTGLDEGQQTSSTPSFAQMLRQGKTRAAEAWPKAKSDAPGPKEGSLKPTDSDDSDTEDRIPVPVFQSSFGDAIQAALDSYQKTPETVKEKEAPGGKKKKTKKKLLFTTSMARMT